MNSILEIDKNPTSRLPNLYGEGAEVQELDLAKEHEERNQQWLKKRMSKFTGSQAYRLMAGVEETEDQAIQSIANSPNWRKQDLIELCENEALDTTGCKLKADYSKLSVTNGLIAYGVMNWPEGAETYVTEKHIEHLTEEPYEEPVTSRDIEHGNEYELEAIDTIIKATNIPFGFTGEDQEFIDCHHKHFNLLIPKELHDYLGCTPDGINVDQKIIAESKCPKKNTHYKYKKGITNQSTLKKNYPQAYWQIIFNMYVTGSKRGIFISYDPRFKKEKDRSIIITVKMNTTDRYHLETRLKMAVARLEKIKNEWT